MGAGGLILIPLFLLYLLAPFHSLFNIQRGTRLRYLGVILITMIGGFALSGLTTNFASTRFMHHLLAFISIGLILTPHLIFIPNLNLHHKHRCYFILGCLVSITYIEVLFGLVSLIIQLLRGTNNNTGEWLSSIKIIMVFILLLNIHIGLSRTVKSNRKNNIDKISI